LRSLSSTGWAGEDSGLHLAADVTSVLELGVGKAPVAAGKGSGGRRFSIVPGKPDESIIYYRIVSTDPGIMMPEMGRKLVHEEGVELVRQWILTMPRP
jgi:Planctomycete cytochrome C